MRLRRLAPTTIALAIALASIACGKKAAPVAELVEGSGAVEREHGGTFAAAPNGQPFFVGDAARTGTGSWARLRLGNRAVMRLGADTLIRFVAGGASLESGEALAEGGPLELRTEAGLAQIEPGGVLRASGGPGGTRYSVDIGRAVIMREDGPVTLEGGAGVVVAVGGAILERVTPADRVDAGVTDAAPAAEIDAAVEPANTVAVTVSGRGVTQRAADGAPWAPLPAGEAALLPGVAVKLPRGAGLTITRGNDSASFRGPAELTVGGPGEPVASARTGSARLAARDAELALTVPGGRVVAPPGSETDIELGRRDTSAKVERGDVTLDGTSTDATARAGETGVLTRDGKASVRDLVPTAIDLALPTGESAVIHDPSRKVAVRIEFGDVCPSGGLLELADRSGSYRAPRRIGGSGGAAFFALAGTNRYRVRCDGGDVVKSGSVRVAGDTGAAPVVRTASTNHVETDGRRYTVTYQNRIPALSVSWDEAPGASVLHVLSGSGSEKTFNATGAHKLASGMLNEGSYTLWITSGSRSSPRTTLKIAFDNAAPTAQITAPAPRAPWGDSIAITGVTVEGWSVAVDGKAADRDASGRFRAEVPAAGKSTVAVRLAHPQHGVHYYLRRRK